VNGFHVTLYDLADGDYFKKKQLEQENIHEILHFLGLKIGFKKAKNKIHNQDKNTIEL